MQAPVPPAAAPKPSLRHQLADRRVPAMLGLGFGSGIPFLLVYTTQSAWLSEAKVPIVVLGLLSEMTLAYKLKFVWAPFLDRYDAPLFSRLLGRRRGWIVVSQIGVMLALAGVAFGDPSQWLAWTIAFCLALGFAGATQDIVVDGWRITVATQEHQAVLSSWAEVGWRLGNLAAGAGALYLADAYGWRAAYLAMAILMIPGLIAAFAAPEPPSDYLAHVAPKSIGAAILDPIRELITRLGPPAALILLMVAGFRMPGYLSTAMAIPLFKSLNYSDTDIATVTKVFGFGVALAGTFLAGFIIPRIGMMASLLAGTVFASASHLSLAYLAAFGGRDSNEFWLFATTVSIDSFAYAFASIVLITYMSSLASDEHAASQYALLTSLCALPGSLLAGTSGFVIADVGFSWFFVGTSLIGIPVALLCWYVLHLHRRGDAPAAPDPA